MFGRTFLIAAVALAFGMPAMAQERGTIEFGGFASHTAFANSMGIKDSFGAGGRIGAFLYPWLSVEVEAGGSMAAQTLDRANVDVGILAARLTGVPFRIGPVSALLGAGIGHTDSHLLETTSEIGEGTSHGQSYGLHALAGVKLALSANAALRADWIETFMWNGGDRMRGLHLGVSVYRHPLSGIRTVTVFEAAPAQQPDSVSAAETRRLRAAEARLLALQDSLADDRARMSAAGLTTMAERIHFAHDQSDLDGSTRAILRDKVAVFRANPAMRIVITGYASEPGTDSYNMALGLRRAAAAKAYLISEGVHESRIEIATRGSELLVEGPSDAANAANRRGEFRVQIAEISSAPGN